MITTITTTPTEDSRISTAFGAELSLGRNATATEVKTAVGAYITTVVMKQEKLIAQATLLAQYVPATPISPT